MSDKRTTARDNEGITITTTTGRANEVSDIIRDNTLRVVDEVAKVQPQYAQAISNLQLDNIQAVRSMVQTAFASARENVKIYGRTVDTLTDFNNNIVKAWTSYWSSPQHQLPQFNRA